MSSSATQLHKCFSLTQPLSLGYAAECFMFSKCGLQTRTLNITWELVQNTNYWAPLKTYPEKAMAPHSSTLAWKIPWTEEPGRFSPWGRWGSDTTERLHFHFSRSCIGEGNGNPLQCSCLENPRDGKPGGLPSTGSHRVRHDWSNLAAAAYFLRNVSSSVNTRIPLLSSTFSCFVKGLRKIQLIQR